MDALRHRYREMLAQFLRALDEPKRRLVRPEDTLKAGARNLFSEFPAVVSRQIAQENSAPRHADGARAWFAEGPFRCLPRHSSVQCARHHGEDQIMPRLILLKRRHVNSVELRESHRLAPHPQSQAASLSGVFSPRFSSSASISGMRPRKALYASAGSMPPPLE